MTLARLVTCLCAVAVAQTADAAGTCSRGSDTSALIAAQFSQLRQTQNDNVRGTLDAIDGMGRRLLALRSYLRSEQDLNSRWSWTQGQIDQYRDSDEYRELLAEIDHIRKRFEADNPGYELYANTDVRSLDQQLERWNSNATVGVIAADLQADVCGMKSRRKDALRSFLSTWQPESPPPLAAPGLSLHGRARAIDFQVHQGNRVIAGPEVARIEQDWVVHGWSGKLAAAVNAASTKFAGPLRMPNEPWHYEYRP